MFLKKIFQVRESFIFSKKNYGKCQKILKYQAGKNRSRKELLGVRTKLSCNKIFLGCVRIKTQDIIYQFMK